MIRLAISIVFTLSFALTSSGQIAENRNAIVYTIDFEDMEGCETGKGDCKPVILKRHSLQDSIKVIFPNGGTQSDVYLYTDTAFRKWMNGKPSDQPNPLLHVQRSAGQEKLTLDLTGLSDGKYRSHMLSCAVGGFFELTIVTEN